MILAIGVQCTPSYRHENSVSDPLHLFLFFHDFLDFCQSRSVSFFSSFSFFCSISSLGMHMFVLLPSAEQVSLTGHFSFAKGPLLLAQFS
jgi:hypothetical protein